ncbi:MAG: efflux RND transporter permease subunit [Gammaproteobacteria bacterium]|nr:efflux RND transporter permease subunit [Gammaproteobacteria bacterium]MBU0771360.1 efflux RND transporter permease subunit [Gammaproteobacteria bacterium]MBU0857124.1 efflux RND transporter permease subunit [Gammaproteobacteria bacterium]MBU1848002.1 efflux RND transporter permease subunit [Gammaproteobacteria bacterium]
MSAYARFISNHPLANITFLVVLLLGLFSYLDLPREQDPEINFNWVQISVALPGASPEDVEKRVLEPLEDAVQNVSDIRFISSAARDGLAGILVRFDEIPASTFDKRVNDLRREIQNKARAELPVEAKDPVIIEITSSNGFPTAQILLTGHADDEVLRALGQQLRTDIERMKGVDRVFALGLHDPELRVEYSAAAAQARGLLPSDIADGVGAWFRDVFAGRSRAGDQEWLVRVVGQDADPGWLADIGVAPQARPGDMVKLDNVARVVRARARPTQLVSSGERPGVLFSVSKKAGVNTLDLIGRINDYVARKNEVLAQQGLKLELMDDQTVPTREAISVMQWNALFGLFMVVLLCWIFLGSRIALLVGLGIPFSLAGTFAILSASGNTLNISVLLGVVIALGMLVDDAVVVVEAIYYRMQRGTPAIDAVAEGVREVWTPVLASVATTMAAFLPLMLLPGIVGDFMFVIPFVVTLALAISLIEAFWMLPSHVLALRVDGARPSRLQRVRSDFTRVLRHRYAVALAWVVRHWIVLCVVVLSLVAGAIGATATGLIRVQFFAFDAMRIFYVNVDMPAGTPIGDTLARVEQMESEVRRHLRDGEARRVASLAGAKFTDTEALFGDAYGQVVVALLPRTGDGREVGAIVDGMRAAIDALPGAGTASFTLLSGGPPVQKPVKVRVRGNDLEELRAASAEVKRIIRAVDGTRDITDDDIPGRPQLALRLERDALREAGLNADQVARAVRLQVEGEIVAVTRDQGDKLEVRVVATGAPANDVMRVLDAPIALPSGGATTLRALVHPDTTRGAGVIKHYDLRRTITVEAGIDTEKLNALQVTEALKAAWEAERTRFPRTDLDFSGELEDVEESLAAMKVLFLLGLGLIYLILAAQFRSYWQPMMILATVPLAFTGVAFGLLASGSPLSLYTLYGVIALTGIVVNSAIVLIDAANERLNAGMSVLHAALYAARRRVVPIIITTSTTVGGLFSLAAGIGGYSLLWGPVAGAIVWGLGVATVLTLFVMPTLYIACMRRTARRRSAF